MRVSTRVFDYSRVRVRVLASNFEYRSNFEYLDKIGFKQLIFKLLCIGMQKIKTDLDAGWLDDVFLKKEGFFYQKIKWYM